MSFPTLSIGSTGDATKHWQHVLITSGLDLGPSGADGKFGNITRLRTIDFQRAHGLTQDGTVDKEDWDAVSKDVHQPAVQASSSQIDQTPAAPFPPIGSNSERAALFGHIAYRPAGTTADPEAIVITNEWARQNIVSIIIPQLARIRGSYAQIGGKQVLAGKGPSSGKVSCHKLIARQLASLWLEIEEANLLNLVYTWDGLWVPRFIRGSRTTLSNHSYATAFDINSRWNPLGATPAAWGTKGSVRELVYLFHRWGFSWGGHFTRADGMHVEATKIIS